VGGIVLVILGGSSTSIGVSLAFIGAVIIVIAIRRLLTSLDRTTSVQKHN
jgi:zinc transporter ZupT